MTQTFLKDPDEKLDYRIDWSTFLADGETIDSSDWTVPSGITEDSSSNTDSAAVIWLTGGTHGQSYDVTNQITTTSGRIAERSLKILVRNR